MANQAQSDISNALATVFDPIVTEAFNRQAVLASLIRKMPGEGKTCAWDVVFSGATAATYTEGADVTTETAQDVIVPASLSWAWYRANFGMTGIAQAAAASSKTSPARIRNLYAQNLRGSLTKLVSTLNADIYDGAGTTGLITGLDSALAATGTYANIAKGTYAEWAGNVVTNSGTPRALTKSLLDELEKDIFAACGENPDIIVTTPTIAMKYSELFDAQANVILVQGELSGAVGTAPPKPPRAKGRTGTYYHGVEVMRDKDCKAENLFMLNSAYIELEILPAVVDMDTGKFISRQLPTDSEGGVVGIPLTFYPLAKTGDSNRYSAVVYCQLKVSQPNAHGLIDDIDES